MRFPAVLILGLVATPALSDGDHRSGRWPCFMGAEPYGALTLSTSGYALSDAPQYAGTGRLTWQGDLFALEDGPLLQGGATGGMVYQPPDHPGTWAVDLYSDMGVVLDCRREK